MTKPKPKAEAIIPRINMENPAHNGPLTPACARLKGGRRLVTAAVFVGYKRRPPAGGQREAKRSVGRRQEAVAIKRRL